MKKIPSSNTKLLKELYAQKKSLEEQLLDAQKREGKDAYIDFKLKKNDAHFKRIVKKGVADKATGNFFLDLQLTAKDQTVYVPLSIASGKKVAGFMYQIEGNAEGSLDGARVSVQGDTVSQVTVGTLLYAKVPAGVTASFEVQATVRGKFGKTYKIVITRINYKLDLTDARYQQYLKEIHSDTVKFS